MNIDHAIEVLRAQESQIRAYRWHFRKTDLDGDPRDLASLTEKKPTLVEGDVWYDVEEGRYRVEGRSVMKWYMGAAPFISSRHNWSFDGETYRSWEQQKHGTEVPETDDVQTSPRIGWVGYERPAGTDTLRSYLVQSGIFTLTPYITLLEADEEPTPLSDLIARRRDVGETVNVSEVVDGTWKIVFAHHASTGLVVVSVDPARNGVITGIEWKAKLDAAPWRQFVTRATQLEGGAWAVTETIDLIPRNRIMRRIVIDRIELNPPLTDADFRLEMPEGTVVDDFAEKTSYVVGGGPENDAAAVRKFIARHELKPLPASEPGGERRGWLRVILLANASAAAVAALYLLFRARRRKSLAKSAGPVLGVLALLLTCGKTMAMEFEEAGGWVARHSEADGLPVLQCGFNVAVLALDLFERKFDAGGLAKELQPTREGILFSDLKNVLRAHGLDVKVRQGVSLDEIAVRLKRNQMAIFPVPRPLDRFHYMSCMRDETGELLALDPPFDVARLDQKRRSQFRDEPYYQNLLVAFVSASTTAAPLSDAITVSPPLAEIGRFDLGDIKRKTRQVVALSLENSTDAPVMVTSVRRSCGCTEIANFSPLLAPRSKMDLEIKLDTASWGSGPHRKEVRFGFADGTEKTFAISAEGYSSYRHATAARKDIVIELPACTEPGSHPAVYRWEFENRQRRGDLAVGSAESWIEPRVEIGDSNISTLVLDLALPADLVARLSRGNRRLVGGVQISYGGEPAYDFRVVVVRKPIVELKPGFVRLDGRARPATSELLLLPNVEGLSYESVGRVWAEPAGLELRTERSAEALAAIICTAPTGTGRSSFVGKCEVHCAGGAVQVIPFAIHVDPQ